MNNRHREIYVPPDGPPQIGRPDPAIFQVMGEENIKRMIFDLYRELHQSSISRLMAGDLDEGAERAAAFFIFLLGGPPAYQEKYGPPMMRKRHLPFEIDDQARRVWLECFKTILVDAENKYNFPPQHLEEFWTFLEEFSSWMVNKK